MEGVQTFFYQIPFITTLTAPMDSGMTGGTAAIAMGELSSGKCVTLNKRDKQIIRILVGLVKL
jgi:hypothetical protein